MVNITPQPIASIYRYLAYGLMIFAVLLLNGCSHVNRKDGPPNFYVDETRIPNAVPKLEPIGKYGNMDHYTVFGKRYYVLRTSKNYQEQGVASWYGTKFHSHHTSNGERYDMLAMTAAHKTLPLPTYVQVTNLKNGKQVIVKINDRGPFESNRLIDLSYVAAKKLGMIGHGTTHVDVKTVDPRDIEPAMLASTTPQRRTMHYPTASQKHTASLDHPTYAKAGKHVKVDDGTTIYLQVGTFHQKAQAEKLKQKLTAMLSTPVKINPSAKAYHLQVGPFKNIVAVDRASKRLKAAGLHSERVVEAFDITRDL